MYSYILYFTFENCDAMQLEDSIVLELTAGPSEIPLSFIKDIPL